MFRGTTPTLKFTLPFDADRLSCAWITLAQNKKDIIDKPMTECACAENVITVTLTQEETLLLNCDYKTEIQIRAKTVDGKALASKIFTVDTERILKDGEI